MTAAALAAALRIPAGLLAAAGWRDATDAEVRAALGYNGHPGCDLSGVLIPVRHPRTGEPLGEWARVANPPAGRGKYLQPQGGRWLYVPPVPREWLDDPNVPVVVVEGPKSALALLALVQRHGRMLVPIACGGCWGWRRNDGFRDSPGGGHESVTAPSPSLDWLAWPDRDCILALDGDTRSNAGVRAALRALATELAGRGAAVRVAVVPEEAGAKAGPDDVIEHCGDDAALAMLDTARPWTECAIAAAEAEIAGLEADRKADPLRAIAAIAAVADPARRGLLIGRLAAPRIPGLTKGAIEAQCARHRAEAEAQRRAAAEAARRGRLLRMAVDPAALVADLECFYAEHAFLPEGAAITLALLTLNTWTFDVFDSTPYLVLESAGPGCGKNRVLIELMGLLVRKPLPIVTPNVAPLFRAVEDLRPTILMSEAEALAGNDADAKTLREILNEGYKRGAKVPRCVGDDHAVQYFDPYCPKFFASIGGLRGALLTRCIVIHMTKRPAGFKLKGKRQKTRERTAAPLRGRIEAYALQAREALARLNDAEPDDGYWPELADREGEVWGPLLMHARLAGPEIERQACSAARLLAGLSRRIQAQDSRLAKAREIADALALLDGERFRPGDLAERLSEAENWGADLGDCRDAKSKAQVIGRFLGNYRLPSYNRDRLGTSYDRLEAIEAINAGLPHPEAPPDTPREVAEGCHVATGPINTLLSAVATLGAVATHCPGDLPRQNGAAATQLGNGADCNGGLPPADPRKHWAGGNVADVADKTGYAGHVTQGALFAPPPDGGETLGEAYARARREGRRAEPGPSPDGRHSDL